MRTCMLSFDVEDWFHVERLRFIVPRSSWSRQELRVEAAVGRVLDLLAQHEVKATFFVLGWVAARCPDVVKRIAADGHEVASHGFHHEPLSVLSEEAFDADVSRSKAILEDLTGTDVLGYRAPTFSLLPWAIPVLRRNGYVYDSSYFPGAYRYDGGDLGGAAAGALISRLDNGMYEVQIPSVGFLGRSIPWGGSGYFRVYPYAVFRAGVQRILRDKHEFVFFMHPWELDHRQPRVPALGWKDRFRQYYGLERTAAKLQKLLRDFRFEPIAHAVRRRIGATTRPT